MLALLLALQSAPVVTYRNPASVPPPIGRYSHVAVVPAGADLLVFAGQVGKRADGTTPTTVEAQYKQALRNVVALLASEGAGPRHLVRITNYLVRPIDPQRAAAIRRTLFGDAAPPSTLVYVSRLSRPGDLVEVEAMAVRPRP
jgi:2-iminobutanoate/2-iminopropanoate deaminase